MDQAHAEVALGGEGVGNGEVEHQQLVLRAVHLRGRRIAAVQCGYTVLRRASYFIQLYEQSITQQHRHYIELQAARLSTGKQLTAEEQQAAPLIRNM